MRRNICSVCNKSFLLPRAAMEDFGKALERAQQAMNRLAALLRKSRRKK